MKCRMPLESLGVRCKLVVKLRGVHDGMVMRAVPRMGMDVISQSRAFLTPPSRPKDAPQWPRVVMSGLNPLPGERVVVTRFRAFADVWRELRWGRWRRLLVFVLGVTEPQLPVLQRFWIRKCCGWSRPLPLLLKPEKPILGPFELGIRGHGVVQANVHILTAVAVLIFAKASCVGPVRCRTGTGPRERHPKGTCFRKRIKIGQVCTRVCWVDGGCSRAGRCANLRRVEWNCGNEGSSTILIGILFAVLISVLTDSAPPP